MHVLFQHHLQCVEQRARKRPSLETGVLLRLGEMVDRITPEIKEAGRARDHFMPALLRCPITKQLMDVRGGGARLIVGSLRFF